MGVAGPVTSPTFDIARLHEGRRRLLHVDAYRLQDPDEEDLGLVGAAAEGALTFVEWPGAAAEGLAPPAVDVGLVHLAPERRLVRLRAPEAAIAEPLAAAIADLRARYRLPESEPGGAGGG